VLLLNEEERARLREVGRRAARGLPPISPERLHDGGFASLGDAVGSAAAKPDRPPS
jgi:hypothetical protein